MLRCVGAPMLLLTVVISRSVLADAPPLDLCDVSWLLPAPQNLSDLGDTISISDLKSATGGPIWSDDQFADLLSVVDKKEAAVGDTHVEFPQAFRSKSAWRIAAFRFDPSAPGCSQAVRDAFGSAPQLRLILQAVTSDDRSIEVHDVAVHLVFSFVAGVDAKRRFLPDDAATRRIIQDLDELKALSEGSGVTTNGKPLGVHPGMANKVAGLRTKVTEFLSRHLDAGRLSGMALMGIRAPEPWIFIALSNQQDRQHFQPVAAACRRK